MSVRTTQSNVMRSVAMWFRFVPLSHKPLPMHYAYSPFLAHMYAPTQYRQSTTTKPPTPHTTTTTVSKTVRLLRSKHIFVRHRPRYSYIYIYTIRSTEYCFPSSGIGIGTQRDKYSKNICNGVHRPAHFASIQIIYFRLFLANANWWCACVCIHSHKVATLPAFSLLYIRSVVYKFELLLHKYHTRAHKQFKHRRSATKWKMAFVAIRPPKTNTDDEH